MDMAVSGKNRWEAIKVTAEGTSWQGDGWAGSEDGWREACENFPREKSRSLFGSQMHTVSQTEDSLATWELGLQEEGHHDSMGCSRCPGLYWGN